MNEIKEMKDNIKRLKMLRDNSTTYGIGFATDALSHAIKILQAVESAEGELPEKKTIAKHFYFGTERAENNQRIGSNQAIDIAIPILAKAKLRIAELEMIVKELEAR